MSKVFAGSLAIIAVLASGLLLTLLPPEPASPTDPIASSTSSSMLIWEAYSRGLISIKQVDVEYTINGQTGVAALGYEVSSTSTGSVAVNEYVMLLSPNPADQIDLPFTTQDGILTDSTIPPSSAVTYGYGEFVAEGILSMPPWWCTEERQYVQAEVPVFLGGEIAPFGLEPILGNMQGGTGGTQDQVWAYLRENPSPVIGKTVNNAFWGEIPETSGQALSVVLRATNLAIWDNNDNLPAPNAPSARVSDRIPPGYTLETGSMSPAGSVTSNPDGSTTVSWVANLPAADVTNKPPNDQPTPYVTRTFSYAMSTPHLAPSRVGLPRATVSVADDSVPEAASEQPLMDVLRVPLPPVADAGSGYAGVEGDTITFNAGASSDPNGDSLQFRWDFTSDGTWDTSWTADPTATYTFGDNLNGRARVEVSDGELTATADAPLTIVNVAPSVTVSIVVCHAQDHDDDDDHEGGDDEGDSKADVGCGGGGTGGDDDDDDEEEGDDEGGGIVFIFTAVATDPGSDDLTFTWSGNCTGFSAPVTYPNDPAVVPDPNPSPDVNPRNVTDVQRVVCGGGEGHDGDHDGDGGDDDGTGDGDDGDDGDHEGGDGDDGDHEGGDGDDGDHEGGDGDDGDHEGGDGDDGDHEGGDGDDGDHDDDQGVAPSFEWHLTVTDDDGGVTVLSGTVTLPTCGNDHDDDGDHDGDGGDDDCARDGDDGDDGDHEGGDGDGGDDDDGGDDGGHDGDDEDGGSVPNPGVNERRRGFQF